MFPLLNVADEYPCSTRFQPEARVAIQALREMGIESWMVTGDNKLTAVAVASKVMELFVWVS